MIEATPSIRQPIRYRGYLLRQGPEGIEIRHVHAPNALITISATMVEAKKEIDGWMWAR